MPKAKGKAKAAAKGKHNKRIRVEKEAEPAAPVRRSTRLATGDPTAEDDEVADTRKDVVGLYEDNDENKGDKNEAEEEEEA